VAEIRPELSAQGQSARPSPMVPIALARLKAMSVKLPRAADQGCGRLRHLDLLSSAHKELYLVDTKRQLEHAQLLEGERMTIGAYVNTRKQHSGGCRLRVQSASEFERSHLQLDVVYSVATLDVVPASTREEMVTAASRNLRSGGIYVMIVPRNDSSILKRCTLDNAYQDGHVFRRAGSLTFYRNFRDPSSLLRLARSAGFSLLEDHSQYRQILLLFSR